MRSAEVVPGGGGQSDGVGGVVVPLRSDPRPVTPAEARSQLPGLGPISPELALIDPELARAARNLLPDLPRATPPARHVAVTPATDQAAVVERLRSSLEPTPDLAAPRRRLRLGRLASAAGLVSLGALLTLIVGRETGPPAPQAQSVAAVLSPQSTPARPAPSVPTPAATQTPGEASTSASSSSPTKAATPASRHDVPVPGQTFVWVEAPGASAYEFQLFRSGERIFRARVDEPRLELPGRWRQAGRPHALVPGSYRWYVWPVSQRTKRPAGVATVQARLVIEGQPR